ncbi:MAG: TRAP transporter substrate-binding protein [Betaproteobacteria bacterium]|nr:TRAP transporter substrate-binding protein [Betaproteobacteria bacterium]
MHPIVMKFGGYQEPASIHNRAAARFGELLKEKLGDRVGFELIGSVLKLGRPSGDLPVMVESGELDFCYMSTVRFAKAVPELKLLELPFVVKDRNRVCDAFVGGFGDLIGRRMREATPYRLLGIWDNGFRHFTNSVRAIRAPADCRGLRIRSQVSELHAELFRAFGFTAIPVDVKQFVEEIASGKFDAQENPLTNTWNFGVHNHHRHFTLSGHLFGAAAFICKEERYQGWPREVRSAVDSLAREATAYQYRLAAAEDAEILAKLDPARNEVVRLTDAERDAFVKAAQPVLDRHRTELDPKLFAYLG